MIKSTIETQPVNPAGDPAVRRTMIGASDGAAILGLMPYGRTRLDVFLEKTGKKVPADLSDVDAVEAGNLLEDDVASMYERRTGRALVQSTETARHPEYPFIGCHPDYIVAGGQRLVECKAIGICNPMTREMREEWGDDGTDQAPQKFLVQCHHQMLVTGHEFCDLAALIGGQGLRIFPVLRDTDFLGWYLKQLVAFWRNHVEAGIPPAPATLNDCKLLYPEDNGAEIEGTAEHAELILALNALTESRKDLVAQEEDLKAKIQAAMGDAAVLRIGGKIAATWKASVSNRLDTKALRFAHPEIAAEFMKATTSRRFLPKKIREVA